MTSDDHFFLAAQRWIHRVEAPSMMLACSTGATTPWGTRQRPAVEIPGCLQELPLHRLVDLSLAGVENLALHPGHCCREADLREVVALWQQQLGDLVELTLIEASPARNWTWSLSPGRVPVDRRGLLGLSRRSTPPWPIHDDDADDHARLLTSLRAAGLATLEEPPPGLSLVASGCTACGVCVAACPHDALALVVDGSQSALVHFPSACQGEQQCIALCPVDALSIDSPLAWADVLDGTPHVLATLAMAVCERCRARFPAASRSRWCETCRIRRSDPFGSHLPEAAIKLLRARGHDHPL